MALSKRAQGFLLDPQKEFAASTGMMLLGLKFKPTGTGWMVIVNRVNKAREKEVLFIEHWSMAEALDTLMEVVYGEDEAYVWKLDKYQ